MTVCVCVKQLSLALGEMPKQRAEERSNVPVNETNQLIIRFRDYVRVFRVVEIIGP